MRELPEFYDVASITVDDTDEAKLDGDFGVKAMLVDNECGVLSEKHLDPTGEKWEKTKQYIKDWLDNL